MEIYIRESGRSTLREVLEGAVVSLRLDGTPKV